MRLPLAIILCLTTSAATAASARCVVYGPEVVKLAGTVTKTQAYGPPGFGEHPTTDSVDRYESLSLDEPICVRQGDSGFLPAHTSIGQVQLIFRESSSVSGFEGQHVSVTGALFPGHSGHHHTKVLVVVQRIDP